MKKSIYYQILFCLLFIQCTYAQTDIEKGQKQITPTLIKNYIEYLASDAMKGRNTPSPELDTAGAYIARQFQSFGLKTVQGSYFQKVCLCTRNLGENNVLKITMNGTEKEFALKIDFVPFEMTANQEVSTSLVFAGYGITAPEYQYDDYQNINAKGKIVVILKHEPGEANSKSPFDGTKDSKYSQLSKKIENAMAHGAVGLLLFTDPLNHQLLTPKGFPWAALNKNMPQDALSLEMCTDDKQIPTAQIGEDVISYLVGSVENMKRIQQTIDSTFTPQSFDIKTSKATFKTNLKINTFNPQNVVGLIEGSDQKLKNEIVMGGGHYDHVGVKRKYKEGEDYIYNGADDNASGTAATMAIAKAVTSLKIKPKRSILFICFIGEEKGLYGSKYYVDHPLFPLENTVAMINMDMVGRNHIDSLEIHGERESPDIDNIIKAENKNFNFTLLYPDNDYFYRSDQYNFFKKDIPAIFFTGGEHSDYHKVTDSADKINNEKAAKISQLAYRTLIQIANDDKRYKVVKKK